jgi:hypothetical protein
MASRWHPSAIPPLVFMMSMSEGGHKELVNGSRGGTAGGGVGSNQSLHVHRKLNERRSGGQNYKQGINPDISMT